MLYLRSLVNFGLNYLFDSIIDIEHAIENSDEANANHYLARGRCYACLSMFKEAITDLSIAINLNKDLLDVSKTKTNLFRHISIGASVLI